MRAGLRTGLTVLGLDGFESQIGEVKECAGLARKHDGVATFIHEGGTFSGECAWECDRHMGMGMRCECGAHLPCAEVAQYSTSTRVTDYQLFAP